VVGLGQRRQWRLAPQLDAELAVRDDARFFLVVVLFLRPRCLDGRGVRHKHGDGVRFRCRSVGRGDRHDDAGVFVRWAGSAVHCASARAGYVFVVVVVALVARLVARLVGGVLWSWS
jgi:hypothetical protein